MSFLHSIQQKSSEGIDSINNSRLKRELLNSLPFWIGAFVTGVVAVGYAKLFNLAESGTLYIIHHVAWSLFLITPICFCLSWWIVKRFANYARGSGIPQVSAALELSNPKYNYTVSKLLSFRIVVIKILSSLIMVFGGGAIGREGPTIQIAASIFKKINDLLPAWYPKISKRNMILTGAAAGLAAAFNTPLGGIVFAIEELTKTHFSYFKSALLAGVIIAGLTALSLFGPYLYIGYPVLNDIIFHNIILAIPVVIVAAFAGNFMGTAILYVTNIKSKIKNTAKMLLFSICLATVTVALAYFINFKVLGSGKEIMINTLFSNQKDMEWYVPFLRIIGPILSFSNGGAGGIFAPTLSTGASIGAVMAEWFKLSATQTNLLILCGMTACLTGITKSPFTSAILVIEMTNTHNVIFHILVSALIANVITAMSKHSFYDYLKDGYIAEVLKTEIPTSNASTDIEEVNEEKPQV